MKTLTSLLLLFMLIACDNQHPEPGNKKNLRALSAEETQVSQRSNDFAFTIFKKIQQAPEKNSFISPLSISMALAMVLNGAEGETQQSILNTIDFSGMDVAEVNQAYKDLSHLLLSMDKKIEVGLANSVWYSQKYNVHPDFASIIQEYYDGKVQSLDFSSSTAKETINNWVENKTNDRIKNLIETISPDEIMFLINAIYFKGDWTYQFDKAKTHDAPFTTAEGNTAQVKMMFSKGVTLNLFRNDDLQLLDVPYGNGQFNFTILLPFDNGKLNAITDNLDAAQLSEWLDRSDSVTVELELPRFTINWKKDLKQALRELGMKMTEFPNLFESPLPLGISKVIHQTYLDVNEEGSEAAAATAIGIELTAALPKPARISINRSFLFMIREKHSGVILFIGKVTDPGLLQKN